MIFPLSRYKNILGNKDLNTEQSRRADQVAQHVLNDIQARTGRWDTATDRVGYFRGDGSGRLLFRPQTITTVNDVAVFENGSYVSLDSTAWGFDARGQYLYGVDGYVFPEAEVLGEYTRPDANIKVSYTLGWDNLEALEAVRPEWVAYWVELTVLLAESRQAAQNEAEGRSVKFDEYRSRLAECFPVRTRAVVT